MHSLIHRLHNPDLAILLLRVGLGLVFVFHGWQKLQNMEQTIGFFATIGISAFWTYVAAWAEFVGGLLLIVGLFVRYAGIVLAIVMAVAVLVVHLKNGYSLQNGGYEYALTLLLGALALAFIGAGRYSVAKLSKRPAICAECNTCHTCNP